MSFWQDGSEDKSTRRFMHVRAHEDHDPEALLRDLAGLGFTDAERFYLPAGPGLDLLSAGQDWLDGWLIRFRSTTPIPKMAGQIAETFEGRAAAWGLHDGEAVFAESDQASTLGAFYGDRPRKVGIIAAWSEEGEGQPLAVRGCKKLGRAQPFTFEDGALFFVDADYGVRTNAAPLRNIFDLVGGWDGSGSFYVDRVDDSHIWWPIDFASLAFKA